MQIIITGNRTSGITCAVNFANKIDDDIKIIFSETQ